MVLLWNIQLRATNVFTIYSSLSYMYIDNVYSRCVFFFKYINRRGLIVSVDLLLYIALKPLKPFFLFFLKKWVFILSEASIIRNELCERKNSRHNHINITYIYIILKERKCWTYIFFCFSCHATWIFVPPYIMYKVKRKIHTIVTCVYWKMVSLFLYLQWQLFNITFLGGI